MMKKNKLLILIVAIAAVIIAVIMILFANMRHTILEEGRHYRIYCNRFSEERYSYEVFDSSNTVFVSEKCNSIPKFMEIDSNILQIQFGSGNAITNQYFDVEKKYKSEVFSKPSAVGYGKIAYMDYSEGKLVLIVQDLFNKNVYYEKFNFDFSPIAVPYNAIVNAQFINANMLDITYFSGEDYTETKLLINL